MSQLEMFAAPAQARAQMPTADSVRPKLDAVLRQLRDGRAANWTHAERRRWAVVFPQMCEWLPDGERESKRTEFRRLWADREG